MSIYVTRSNRLALKCDRCGGRFHPRAEALNVVALRIRAARQGWRASVSEDRQETDYCTRACERVAAEGRNPNV